MYYLPFSMFVYPVNHIHIWETESNCILLQLKNFTGMTQYFNTPKMNNIPLQNIAQLLNNTYNYQYYIAKLHLKVYTCIVLQHHLHQSLTPGLDTNTSPFDIKYRLAGLQKCWPNSMKLTYFLIYRLAGLQKLTLFNEVDLLLELHGISKTQFLRYICDI